MSKTVQTLYGTLDDKKLKILKDAVDEALVVMSEMDQKKKHLKDIVRQQYVNSYFKPVNSMKVDNIIRQAIPDKPSNSGISDSEGLSRAYSAPNSIFVYISTDSVFNGEKGDYIENDCLNPINNYALTKVKGEEQVKKHFKNYLINHLL